MIRISIFFLAFFSIWTLPHGWGQDRVNFICYDHDIIAWELSTPGCPDPVKDSLFVFIQETATSEFTLLYADKAIVGGIQDDAVKTAHAVYVEYMIRCPDTRIIRSDTTSLTDMRQAVELDSVRVLANGNVQLTWKEKPISRVRYIVNSVVNGSSSVLASNISGNTYTDTRGLVTDDIEYYSISASLMCGYTFPEPDSFFHTSYLNYKIAPCGEGISFDLIPFSYWKGGTATSTLMVFSNGKMIDSIKLNTGQTTFGYDKIENNRTYTFYVQESGNDGDAQKAYSNPITISTDYYDPIRWIVIDKITFDDQNQATISWKTNDHTPEFSFQLSIDKSTTEIPESDLILRSDPYHYSYQLLRLPDDGASYRISLKDTCGNTIESAAKIALLTQGKLNGGTELNIEWSDISHEEWILHSYDIYTQTNGTFSQLGSTNGSTFDYHHSFDKNNPLDSLCYYVVAKGDVYYPDIDSTADLSIQSNTVCLHGETIVELPNAYHPNEPPYRPIIIPESNITSYDFRVFDRYGSLVFETNNPAEGWNGQHQGKNGFVDVYVVQVELTNNQGEQIKKSGSLMLFP